MASELKPCPFCGGNNLNTYYCDIEGWIAHIKCDDCDDMIGPMSEYKYESQEEAYKDAATRWNTRPAPAATDTGLETVGYAHRGTIGLLLEGAVSKAVIVLKAGGDFRTPVMLVEQAVELLAAKDADIDRVLADNRRCIGRIAELEADNAAQAARIKELDRCHEGTIDLCNQKTAQIEALEAKLAAAGMALKRADEALQLDAKASGHTYVKLALAEVRS